MLFEELIEQHRVHGFVAHRVRSACSVASDQIRIHFFHLLGHEAELGDGVRVEVVLVVERDRFQRKNCFTRLVHRLDRVLEALRRSDRPEVAIGIYDHRHTSCYRHAADPGDIRIGMGAFRANADSARVARYAQVGDVDIVTAGGKEKARAQPNGDVRAASRIAIKGARPQGSVIDPAGVFMKRKVPFRGVASPAKIIEKRRGTIGGVIASGSVAIKSVKTVRGIAAAGRVAFQCLIAGGCVVVGSVCGERIDSGCGIVAPGLVA